MKVLWIAGTTEIEEDVRRDCAAAGIQCVLINAYDIAAKDIPARVRAEAADLTVLRYPFYLAAEVEPEARAAAQALEGPVVAWSSEQGPTKNDGECLIGGFRHRAVNNARDARAGGYLHMPFGCAVAARPDVSKIADVVCDSNRPHYACRDCPGGDTKAQSVRTMILPLIKASLSLYGEWEGPHGWASVPGATPHYRGKFGSTLVDEVCAKHRVYVGISWNWNASGYGCKLARAMATGIPIVWHRTPHMADDGLEEGKNILCSSSPEETRERVREALAKPEIGEAGRRFALEHWRWSTLLRKLASEVS